ncbi:MAG: hypothetical protein WC717_00175 [Candidatus Micrarchaeia archaeon]
MATAQIPQHHKAKIKSFVDDVQRGVRGMQNARGSQKNRVAFDLYFRYNNSEFVRLAEEYRIKLNGDSPGLKQQITLALSEFAKIGVLVESAILPSKNRVFPHEKELTDFDFLGYTPGGTHIDILPAKAEKAVA